jgi:5-methylcytosine-specific restriction protein A
MPMLPPRVCAAPGCGRATTHGRCPKHAEAHAEEQRAQRAKADQRRGTARERGYGPKWSAAREGFLAKHPKCVDPFRLHGPTVDASVVDHIVPHKGDFSSGGLFWDRHNWQPLCKSCHDRKTAAENGGFGNAIHRTGTAPR